MKKWPRPLILASLSPRRALLLAKAGIEATPYPPEINDGIYTCGTMSVDAWVQSLAVLKAQHVRDRVTVTHSGGTVLAADTVCVVDGEILGQPKDALGASSMLCNINNRSHEVCTGWCLLAIDSQRLQCGCEIAEILMGQLEEDEIERYVASGQWQGKAGGYNLSQQVAARWPITCKGDPTSVMGLPMDRLLPELCREQD